MRRILVPTDFSTRSDRAVRRACLLAAQFSASLVLVHVVDDDQPARLVEARREEATTLLSELAASLGNEHKVKCEAVVALGEPCQGVLQAAEDAGADLLVMGSPRRRLLGDVFVGTTIERTLRAGRRPVLMAAAVPTGHYRRVMLAVDFSQACAAAFAAARDLGLLDEVRVTVMNAYEAPAQSMLLTASTTTAEFKAYLATQEARAARALDTFLAEANFSPARRAFALIESTAAAAILKTARKEKADLVVIGTHGLGGIPRLLLGSVAEGVLRACALDVLAVPSPRRSMPEGPGG
jgi:nucleotide-binding universal stress UspA family protein